jgi:uncharacterized membrane protein
MRDEDDPFLRLMAFLRGSEGKAAAFGAKLEWGVDVLVSNAFMSAYLAALFLVALLLASPLLITSDAPGPRDLGALFHVTSGLFMLCHQLPYRSFILWGVPEPVCARDVGIYVGAMAGLATALLKDRPRILSSIRLFALGFLPIAADGITQTILLLRESNNPLRFATGLIFGFCVLAFLTNRVLLPRQPAFREHVVGTRMVLLDAVVVLLALDAVFLSLGAAVGTDYMARSEAVRLATSYSQDKNPVEVDAFYVSSLAPATVLADPYYDRHRDAILDDIRSSGWAAERVQRLLGNGTQPAYPENASVSELLASMAEGEHKLGIWAVAVLSEPPKGGDAPYLEAGRGDYYYFDAYTGALIMKVAH